MLFRNLLVFITWQPVNSVFKNTRQTQCLPWAASLGSILVFQLAVKLWRGDVPVMWLETLLSGPISTKRGPLWRMGHRIRRNNKNLQFSKTALKVNWVSPSTGFHFLFKSFWGGGIREHWAGTPARLFHSCVALGKPLVSHLCFPYHPFSVSLSPLSTLPAFKPHSMVVKTRGLWNQIWILSSLPASCVTWGNLLKFPVPQFPHL